MRTKQEGAEPMAALEEHRINPKPEARGMYALEEFIDLDADSSVRYVTRLVHVGCDDVCQHGGIGVGPSLEAALFDARFQANKSRS